MKNFRSILTVLAIAAICGVSAQADARGHGGGGRGGFGHGGYGRGAGIGLGLGLGFGALYYGSQAYSPYYYPAPVYVQPPVYTQPPIYMQDPQGPPQVAPQSASWYYCASKRNYYPYVTDCAEGWQAVAPQPPLAPR